MAVTWNVYQGGDEIGFLGPLFFGLRDGSVVDASAESVTVAHEDFSIVLEGDIILTGNEPTAGMINTIRVYDGDVLLAEATGYWLDLDVIGDAIDEFQGGSAAMLIEIFGWQPVTFNGSDQEDAFVDGDFAGTYYGNGGSDLFSGGGGDDELNGGAGGDRLFGSEGNDTIKGGDGSDDLKGEVGDDLLKGGDGNDDLDGGPGSDTLTGGKNADTFMFSETPLAGEVDTVTDFKAGVDVIMLDSNDFAGLGALGTLAAGKFHVGNNAHDASDRIIYNANTGALYYDSDGDGATAKIKFATLANTPDLAHTDIVVDLL